MKLRLSFFFFLAILFFSSLSAQQTVGLFQNDSTAFNGYTLFAPITSTSTYLIDNCGELIHSWEGNSMPGISAYLLEDGRLLRPERILSNFNAGGTGGRITISDWDSNLLWSFTYSTELFHHHHDVEFLPNGNVLLIAWELKSQVETIEAGRDPATVLPGGFWPDHIVEVQPVGQFGGTVVWEWHAWDHLIQDFDSTKANYGVVADHPELLDINYSEGGGVITDWNHINSIDYNSELDQIVLSSRTFNEFWIIDHSTTTAEAAGHSGGNSGKGGDLLYRWGNPITYKRGTVEDQKLFGQHDAYWIEEGLVHAGQIMVFNNGVGRPGGNRSSIDVIEPPIDLDGNYHIEPGLSYGPEFLSWVYDPLGGPNLFYAQRVSNGQRLPNGNTLICDGVNGHFFEINISGEIVWDYVNPVTGAGPIPQGGTANGNDTFRAYRYPADFQGLTGQDLTPMGPLELDPLMTECNLFSPVEELFVPTFQVFPNPFQDWLKLEREDSKETNITIIDITGKIWKTAIWNDYSLELNVSDLPSGFYFMQIGKQGIQKLVKGVGNK